MGFAPPEDRPLQGYSRALDDTKRFICKTLLVGLATSGALACAVDVLVRVHRKDPTVAKKCVFFIIVSFIACSSAQRVNNKLCCAFVLAGLQSDNRNLPDVAAHEECSLSRIASLYDAATLSNVNDNEKITAGVTLRYGCVLLLISWASTLHLLCSSLCQRFLALYYGDGKPKALYVTPKHSQWHVHLSPPTVLQLLIDGGVPHDDLPAPDGCCVVDLLNRSARKVVHLSKQVCTTYSLLYVPCSHDCL